MMVVIAAGTGTSDGTLFNQKVFLLYQLAVVYALYPYMFIISLLCK